MTLEERVRSWLKDHGYPLEMRVAELLRGAGAGWDHGRVYQDPITNKAREIDLIGYFDHKDPSLSVHPVFECKHAKDKPWVLFCTNRPALTPRGFIASVPATKDARDTVSLLLREYSLGPRMERMKIFAPHALTGFNLVRAHTEHQDAAFHAVSGVSAAATTVAEHIGKFGHRVLYPPVIVVDSPLMRCHLPANDAEVELAQIAHGVLLHNPGIANRVLIHVVHVDYVAEFLRNIREDATTLAEFVRVHKVGLDA